MARDTAKDGRVAAKLAHSDAVSTVQPMPYPEDSNQMRVNCPGHFSYSEVKELKNMGWTICGVTDDKFYVVEERWI